MHEWFGRYMQSEIERFLSDPFDEMCEMLNDEVAFSFSRFGDGEFNAIFGVGGANCDGHRYHPELGRRLREIVDSGPDYLMGLQTHAMLMHGARRIRDMSAKVPWVLADSLHNASMEGRFGEMLTLLDRREVTLVGATHHRSLAEQRSWKYVEIADGDCWPQYRSLLERLEPRASAATGEVFLFCASMTANVLIDDLHGLNRTNTYIDAGSVLDPYVGVSSRGYHQELNSADPAKGIVG